MFCCAELCVLHDDCRVNGAASAVSIAVEHFYSKRESVPLSVWKVFNYSCNTIYRRLNLFDHFVSCWLSFLFVGFVCLHQYKSVSKSSFRFISFLTKKRVIVRDLTIFFGVNNCLRFHIDEQILLLLVFFWLCFVSRSYWTKKNWFFHPIQLCNKSRIKNIGNMNFVHFWFTMCLWIFAVSVAFTMCLIVIVVD